MNRTDLASADSNLTAALCELARLRCLVDVLMPSVQAPSPASNQVPDTWDDGPSLYVPRVSTVGWNKSGWTSGEWASWLVTGPCTSLAFVFFVLYCFGPLAAGAALLVCVAVDSATFYWNW